MFNNIENFEAALSLGGIERQEKKGQITQASLETLPKDSPLDKLVELGFKYLGTTDDTLFDNYKFPKGWKKIPTAHAMWTDLIDGTGRKRGEIFYKAAFYDRCAFMRLIDES